MKNCFYIIPAALLFTGCESNTINLEQNPKQIKVEQNNNMAAVEQDSEYSNSHDVAVSYGNHESIQVREVFERYEFLKDNFFMQSKGIKNNVKSLQEFSVEYENVVHEFAQFLLLDELLKTKYDKHKSLNAQHQRAMDKILSLLYAKFRAPVLFAKLEDILSQIQAQHGDISRFSTYSYTQLYIKALEIMQLSMLLESINNKNTTFYNFNGEVLTPSNLRLHYPLETKDKKANTPPKPDTRVLKISFTNYTINDVIPEYTRSASANKRIDLLTNFGDKLLSFAVYKIVLNDADSHSFKNKPEIKQLFQVNKAVSQKAILRQQITKELSSSHPALIDKLSNMVMHQIKTTPSDITKHFENNKKTAIKNQVVHYLSDMRLLGGLHAMAGEMKMKLFSLHGEELPLNLKFPKAQSNLGIFVYHYLKNQTAIDIQKSLNKSE